MGDGPWGVGVRGVSPWLSEGSLTRSREAAKVQPQLGTVLQRGRWLLFFCDR